MPKIITTTSYQNNRINQIKNMLAIAKFDRSKKLKDIGSALGFINFIKKEPLKKETLLRVGRKFNFTDGQYASVLGVSTHRRQKPGTRVSIGASEYAYRLAELYEKGMDFFDGDGKNFIRWMYSEMPVFGNKRPIDLAETAMGAEIVNDTLMRMEYGVLD